jgi:hypothetical protein
VGVLSIGRGRAEVQISDRLGSLSETGDAVAVLEDGRWRIAQLPRSETVGRYLDYRVPSVAMSSTLRADQVVLVDPNAYIRHGP